MNRRIAFLLSALLLLSSCAKEDVPETEPETEAPEGEAYVIPAEWGEDAAKLLSSSWTAFAPDAAASLTFDSGRLEWKWAAGGKTGTAAGTPVFDGRHVTLDGVSLDFDVLASFCVLDADGTEWKLIRAESPGDARQAVELVTQNWEGGGAALRFDGAEASFTTPDGGSASGLWTFSDGVLTLGSDTGYNGNLAFGAKVTASSVETPDFPPEFAVDGDAGTRSSAYEDPTWLTVDLGAVRSVGMAVITFETACSSEFSFSVSTDGNTFTEAAHVKGNTTAGAPITVPFDGTREARYVRFTGLSRATQWGHSIYELELYGSLPGENSAEIRFGDGEITVTAGGVQYVMKPAG